MTNDRRPKQLSLTPADPLQVLIAGGPADVAKELRAWLAPRGLRVANHWPSDKTRVFDRPVPAGTQFVIILVKHLGHSAYDAVVRACKRAGVRYVRTVWNRSRLAAALAEAGVKLAAPRAAFDPSPQHEEADDDVARCAYVAEGRRCIDAAADGDALCAAHRAAYEAEARRTTAPPAAAVATIAAAVALDPPAPSATTPAADAAPAPGAPPPGCVPAPTKVQSVWSPAHVEVLTKLVEAGVTDAAALAADLRRLTGVYRTPGSISIFLRPLATAGIIRTAPALLTNLERLSKAQTAARRAVDMAEATALKHDRPPELLSRAAATKLLGGVGNRITKLSGWLETATGRYVYRRADVQARQAELRRFTTDGDLRGEVGITTAVPLDEVAARLRAALRAAPGRGTHALGAAVHVDRRRAMVVLGQLVTAGEAVYAPGAGKYGCDLYGPPGWTPTARRPKQPKRAKAPAAPAVTAALPLVNAVVFTDPVLEVIKAIGDGRLDPAAGAAVLAGLRGGGR